MPEMAPATRGEGWEMAVEPAESTSEETVAAAASADKHSRPRRNAYLALLAALICGGVAILIYNWLNSWHPAAGLKTSTSDLSTLPELTVTKSAVQWQVQGGFIRELVVQGPALGWADIELPLPPSLCAPMAAALHLTCKDGRLQAMTAPAQFSWSVPVEVSTPAGLVNSTALDLQTVAGPGGAYGADISALTRSAPTLCFFVPDPSRLTVIAGGWKFSHEVSPSQVPACGQGAGVTAIVGSAGSGQPPGFDFTQVNSLTVVASGPAETLTHISGQTDLDPGGTTLLVSTDATYLRAADSAPLVTTLAINPGPGNSFLETTSDQTTSVMTGIGQLVPSFWARHATVLVPALGGFATMFVVGPLGAWLRFEVDALLTWPDPARRRRRRESQPEATDAPS
jgi:hypothetical protein